MELTWLRYFVKLAEVGHMGKTAQMLGVSQPNLSMVIRRLEENLGVSLFDRVGRGIVLNDYGKTFLRYARRVLVSLDAAKRELSYMKEESDRNITIVTTGTTFLLGLLTEFLKDRSDVRIRQSVVSPERARDMLLDSSVDFAITSPPLEDEEDIRTRELYSDPILLAVGYSHHLSGKDSVDLRDLREETFIEIVEGYTFRKLTEYMCLLAGFTPKVLFEGEIMLMAELVEKGLGVALVPLSVMKLYPDFPVKLLKVEYPKYERTVSISWNRNTFLGGVKKDFLDFAISYYRDGNHGDSL